ncbi:MAG: restriction endonuclease [Lachnospiraceae bacterium]|nr:restriction endonuclease [Lachnospiraceae bacterium]
MNDSISSAGLVYVYLNGYEEDGILSIQTTDTYHYMEDAFYRQVTEKIAVADEDDAMVHIFAVVGAKDKTAMVYRLIEDELRENFQRILEEKSIRKSLQKLDKTGNAFLKCVQEFFCEQLGHFPKRVFRDYGDLVFAGICCSRLPEDVGDSIADGIVSLWMEREEPCLCGRQLMIRSFFLRDLAGRKVVACIPQMQTGSWSLVFEGGHQLSMETGFSYRKETIHPKELGGFISSNLQTILMNPVYAYGTCFQPNALCEEWHKAFLYLCAVSECVWDQHSISKAYKRFLKFLRDCICETIDAEPIISKEKYHDVLLGHIQRFRAFLKGEDEPVISKDLHQTLNCRYVYLPYLWSLVPQREICADFSPSVLHNMVNEAISIGDTHEKGVLWEEAAVYVLKSIVGWKITGRRIRAASQEIDISVVNVSLDDELWKLGAYILVECKNWRKRVDLHQIRNIAHISNMKGNKTVILFSANGITRDAEREIHRLLSEYRSVICITAEDLLQIQNASDCRNLILKKWQILQDAIDIATVI